MPTAEEITHHHDDDHDDSEAWVEGYVQPLFQFEIVEYDDRWPADFELVAGRIREALGDRVLELHHVGSTSVPGLPAKPVIDVDLVVSDPTYEASYIPDLVAAGFVHAIREPWWHEHRLVKGDDPVAFVHIFGPDCPEVVRHRMFHDWLVARPDEREVYAAAKRAAAAEITQRPGGGSGMDYNRHKEPVLRAMYDRMFRAHGLLP